MTVAPQFELDLAGDSLESRLRAQYAANMARDAHNWTTEAMAMHWSGIHHREDWERLPRYERASVIRYYEAEQEHLACLQNAWQPLYELIHPDGTAEMMPPRPFRIRSHDEVRGWKVDQTAIDQHNLLAKRMADQLAADWSAGRPSSVRTYNPFLASTVSLLLGRKVEAVLPENIEDRTYIPIHWIFIQAIDKARQL